MTHQERHEHLVKLLSKHPTFMDAGKPRFRLRKEEVHSGVVHELDDNEINAAVILMVTALNLSGGSVAGNINLYELLQAYLTVPGCREKINATVQEALQLRHALHKVERHERP